MYDFNKYPTHRFEFYSEADFKGPSSSSPKQFSSDEEAIKAAKKELAETNKEFGKKFYGSMQVIKYNGYWPEESNHFKGSLDVIFEMNAEDVIDDDSPRTFYLLTGWRMGLSQDCSFKAVTMRPSETHFENGLRYDKNHNRVCTWSEKLDLEAYSAYD